MSGHTYTQATYLGCQAGRAHSYVLTAPNRNRINRHGSEKVSTPYDSYCVRQKRDFLKNEQVVTTSIVVPFI